MSIYFSDHPEFTPDLTPREIFELGSFGGTYWRPIYRGKNYKDEYKKFDFLRDLDPRLLTNTEYDKSINKYKVKVGSSLETWEKSGWINPIDPYGWVQWYCNFYAGRRSNDDDRQIKRWQSVKSRFTKVTFAIRQTLQHWAISS